MKDVHQQYRKSVYNTIAGVVTYNAVAVPVYTFVAETPDDLYIVINDASGVQSDINKEKFITDSTLMIDIIHLQTRAVSTTVVDDVYNQIVELLIPKPFTPGFIMPAPFKASNIEVLTDSHIFDPGLDNVVRKVFRLKCQIQQDEFF